MDTWRTLRAVAHPRMLLPRGGLLVAVALALAACDTGDGTTLAVPSSPTTLPPPDTTPLPSSPINTATDAPPALDTGPIDTGSIDSELSPLVDFEVFAPWNDGGPIASRYGCDGLDIAPPLTWVSVPQGTSELAVSFVNESNLSNGRPFVHWIIAGLEVADGGLEEGEVPLGAFQALNFFGEVGYTGPCPLPGNTATFRLSVHALGQQLELTDGTPATELLDTIDAITIARADTTGTSTR